MDYEMEENPTSTVVVLIVMGVETESAVMWLETVHPINAKTDAACPVPMAWSTELRAMWTVAAPAPPALLGRSAPAATTAKVDCVPMVYARMRIVMTA